VRVTLKAIHDELQRQGHEARLRKVNDWLDNPVREQPGTPSRIIPESGSSSTGFLA
jgi:hypothetical protein